MIQEKEYNFSVQMPLSNYIAYKLKYIRKSKELSRADLAKRLEVTANNIGQLEDGSRGISINKLQKLCKALGIKSSELLPF
ncbi:helix-turn-helix domain-containing protein [Flagellimonas sp. CMM7]|uniref:helix-turn-helix domain-containing protein n=1 Tax=Flagellimonas sp. CMM7 TaxID=2654676 RepID=UPI0013D25EF4|nr:helix-turn-helix transcriptional regulator [Flagellimonas sp. CMM7]UII80021.1 helix-turn-helix domain-containing protein [Flagellimonas sp. CMM7]